MFEKLLLPLDGSEVAEAAVPYAWLLAEHLGSEIDLLAVAEDPRMPQRLLESYVERWVAQLQQAGFKSRGAVCPGIAAECILNFAEENGIKAIVMATHGRSGDGRWSLGSVADKVLHASRIPLFLVSSRVTKEELKERGTPRRILVPLDGSDIGEAALPFAVELARKTNARLLLFTVFQVSYPWVAVPGYGGLEIEPLLRSQQAQAEGYLAKVENKVGDKAIAISREVLPGVPAEVILNYAKEQKVDLVAMSTHGRSGVGRWVLGSVTEKVVRAAETPVLVVRASGQHSCQV